MPGWVDIAGIDRSACARLKFKRWGETNTDDDGGATLASSTQEISVRREQEWKGLHSAV